MKLVIRFILIFARFFAQWFRPRNTFGSRPKGFPKVDEIMRVFVCVFFLTFLHNSIGFFTRQNQFSWGWGSHFNTCCVPNSKQRNNVGMFDCDSRFIRSTWKTDKLLKNNYFQWKRKEDAKIENKAFEWSNEEDVKVNKFTQNYRCWF